MPMNEHCVALLGRRDLPTDAVEEYCRYLSTSLQHGGVALEITRVAWMEKGWRDALQDLRRKVGSQQNSWYLLQYTALAWSRRGFPWRVLSVMHLLKKSGVRCAVVFHDAEMYFGNRIVDRVRRAVQLYTMRKTMRLANLSILTIPREKIPWITGESLNTVFIPVGANLPAPERAWPKAPVEPRRSPAVAIFSLSEGRVGEEEAELIAEAALYVTERIGALRIVVLGRNSEIARTRLRERLGAKSVELIFHGILPAEDVVQVLGSCDAMLFVRGPISTRRGSAIAGIACGLPVIAREGWETAAPVTEAGVVLVPPAAKLEFGPALLRVLTDVSYRTLLAERSRKAQTQYFSWEVIAALYVSALREYEPQK
jgi:hypothetical protein